MLRVAETADVAAVRQFGEVHIRSHYTPLIGAEAAERQVRRWWNETELAAAAAAGRVVVAEDGGEVAGVGQIGADCVVGELYLEPLHRGQGLGPKLLGTLAARVPDGGLRVEHFAADQRAGAFYEREGFAVERIEAGLGGDPALAVVRRTRGTVRCPHGWRVRETGLACLDDLEVVFPGEPPEAVAVRFAERHAATHHLDRRLFFAVQATAPGLNARLEGVGNYVDGRGLAQFLDRLDFRGWEGEQRWTSADRDVSVAATYRPGGRIELAWTIRPWRQSVFGEWEATVLTSIEAGAEKDELAARLHHFLTAEGFPVDYR
ncbi:DUF6228 family protein [Amycolatopsis benzoatilytica]|uniref:DUF6228 family protein n=1 Tax=Amycolatopsis benzoatilytica TaxID=346045 RepID=UPI0003A7D5C0